MKCRNAGPTGHPVGLAATGNYHRPGWCQERRQAIENAKAIDSKLNKEEIEIITDYLEQLELACNIDLTLVLPF